MNDEPNDYKLISAMNEAKSRAEDRQFQQDAIAGSETGHGNRHHLSGKPGHERERRKRRDERINSALDIMLADPAYAASYHAFGDFLIDAETKADTMLVQAKAEMVEAANALSALRDRANQLPDGTRVFRTSDGRVVDEHGRVISQSDADGIVWKDGAPIYEEYLEAKRRADETAQMIAELERYRVDVLGKARDQWKDRENPITVEEMDALETEIEAAMPDIEPPPLPHEGLQFSESDRSPLAAEIPTLKN